MKKYGLAAALLAAPVLCVLAYSRTALAHVLLVDDRTNIAAVLHINPGDDPVAGEASELYFDIQDANSNIRIPYSAYQLVVTDDEDNQVVVVTRYDGSTVSAKYTFPAQGLYRLALRSNPAYSSLQKVSLETSLRISRGTGVHPEQPHHQWASFGLITGGALWLMLVIAGVNNREEIIADSRF